MVQLINNGLTVVENAITVEFSRSVNVPLSCRLDGTLFDTSCESPLRLSNLSPGEHRLAIKPACGSAIATKFNI